MKPKAATGVYGDEYLMKCHQCRAQIKIWMSEDSGNPPPREVIAHAQTCDACGAALDAARMLVSGRGLRCEPPPFLATRISARLTQMRPRGRRPALVPAAAAIAVLIALAGGLVGRYVPRRMVVEFRVEVPGASSVHLVGDFNGWDTEADPLSDPDADGIWETKLRLVPSREYRYQFHVDGSDWIADPRAEIRIGDGFGGETSVLQI